MPVFHTKTIESILEPVAQQVSIVRDCSAEGSRFLYRMFCEAKIFRPKVRKYRPTDAPQDLPRQMYTQERQLPV